MRRSTLNGGGLIKDPKLNAASIINQKSINEASHGEVITTNDGQTGWVIDREVEKDQSIDPRMKTFLKVCDPNSNQLFENIEVDPHLTFDEDKFNNLDPMDRMKINGVKEKFKNYTYGSTGLVKKGDPKSKIFEQRMADLKSGKVRLPSVAEYEAQKKSLEEKKKMEQNNLVNQDQTVDNEPAPVVEREITAPAEKIERIEKKEEPKVFNLAEAEEAQQKINNPVQAPEEIEEDPGIVIQIPAEEAETFVETMPEEIKDKMVTSKVIKVESVSIDTIPTADVEITSVSELKVTSPKKVVGRNIKKVLINSGYIVTVCKANSLEYTSMINSTTGSDIDVPRMIQFAFDHIITTSIGNLTFRKFLNETAYGDIPIIIAAIYQASEPEIKTVKLPCQTCGGSYSVRFAVPSIFSNDNFSDETIDYFNEIIDAENDLIKAREVHKKAPVMQIKCVEIFDYYFISRVTNAGWAYKYYPKRDNARKLYGDIVALYINKITEVRYVENGHKYFSQDPDVIGQILMNIGDDNELEKLGYFLADNIPEYDNYNFAMKPIKEGAVFKCDKCGRTVDQFDFLPLELVFLKTVEIVLRPL